MEGVSIIIPNWNGRNLLEKNLPHVLAAFDNKKNNIIEVIVVDDKSTDDSLEILKRFKDRVKVVKHTQNRGFSYTVNTGARTAKGKLICLLNTDVVPSDDFLVSTLKHFGDNKVFAVSLHEQGFGNGLAKFKNGLVEIVAGKETDQVSETFWVSGGSGVFKRDMWMRLGGLDEKLLSPFYWEDFDLGYRAQKRGYRLLWEPKANVEHKHETTISTNNFRKRKLDLIKQRNRLLVIWKNLTSVPLFRKHLRFLVSYTFRHPGYVIILLATLPKLRLVLRARKKEKKEASVSDEALFARFERV